MLYQNLHVFARSLRLLDAFTLACCVIVPWAARLPAGAWDGIRFRHLAVFLAILVATFTLIARRMHIYHARRTETLGRELLALFEASALSLGMAALATDVLLGGFPGAAYATVALAGLGVLIGMRLAVRLVLRRLRRTGRDYRTFLLVGRNARAAAIARDILGHPHYGIRIAGVVDAPARAPTGAGDPAAEFARPPLAQLPVRIIESPDSIRAALSGEVVDEVIVTLPMRSFYDEIAEIVRLCSRGGISVRLPAASFGGIEGGTEVSALGRQSFVTHFTGPSHAARLALKRLLDLFVAAWALLLLSPLLALVALAVKLGSRGPVFFRQTRVGLNGRLFTVYKFRTMREGAHEEVASLAALNEADGPVFKLRDDPRITPLGRVLRRFFIDELPQLWNVLNGEMSLVGPRPPLPEETAHYEWWQRRRLSMPPGLTCLWQVHENHHKLPFKRWMELDLEYIDRWSLRLDARLLLDTLGLVLRGQGW